MQFSPPPTRSLLTGLNLVSNSAVLSDGHYSNFCDFVHTDGVHSNHLQPYIVGDLTKMEAEKYFNDIVAYRYGGDPVVKEELLKKGFDNFINITGTRIHTIK